VQQSHFSHPGVGWSKKLSKTTAVPASTKKLQIQCPTCDRRLTVPATAAGKLVNCPCGIQVPVTKANVAPPVRELALANDPFAATPQHNVPRRSPKMQSRNALARRRRKGAGDKPTAVQIGLALFAAGCCVVTFLIVLGILLLQEVPTSEIPNGLRGEDRTNAYIARHPEYIGYFCVPFSLILFGYGIFGLTTGTMFSKFGRKLTGFNAKATAWVVIAFGFNVMVLGLGSIIKGFLV